MKKKNSLTASLLIIAGIIILFNILSVRYFARLDFTSDQRYTLSKATKDIVRTLDNPVTITAYFSEGLPANITQIRSEFRDLLTEYANASKGKVVYEFINPNKNEENEQKAVKAGISPVIINVREKDESVQKKAYLGAVIQYNGKSEVIPFIQPGSAMEYALSSSIKKVSIDNKPLIGFIQGNGQPSLQSMQQAIQSLHVLYQVEPVNLGEMPRLDKYKTLAMVAPRDSIPGEQLQLLDQYLANGGNLYIAMNRVEGDLSQATGYEISTGLESWLERKGIRVENKFLVDASCGSVTVMQQQGYFNIQSQVKFPYLPLINNFSDHPAGKGIETVVFQFASPISFTGDTSLHFRPVALSSERSGTVMLPLYFDINKRWSDRDYTLPHQTVAASIEGPIVGNRQSRMVVIGDGDFAINGEGQQAKQINPDNVNLMVNSIDWLSDDTGLIALRTKGIINRPLDQVEDGRKSFLKYLNFLLPVLLIIGFGIFRNQQNRIKRAKRMQEYYF